MLVRTLIVVSLLVICSTPRALAQDATAVVAAASKAMGMENLNAIAYIGNARAWAPSAREEHRRSHGRS